METVSFPHAFPCGLWALSPTQLFLLFFFFLIQTQYLNLPLLLILQERNSFLSFSNWKWILFPTERRPPPRPLRRPLQLRLRPHRRRGWSTWLSPWSWSTSSCGSHSSTTRRRSEPTTASSRRRYPPWSVAFPRPPIQMSPTTTPFTTSALSCPDSKGSKGRYELGSLVFRFGWLASGRKCKFRLNWGQINVLALFVSRFS